MFSRNTCIIICCVAVVVTLTCICTPPTRTTSPGLMTRSPAPTQDPNVLTFDMVCLETSKLTELQLKAHAESMLNLRVENWRGYVFDAGASSIEIAMEARGGNPFIWLRQIELLDVPVSIAQTLKVNQPVRFSGVITTGAHFSGLLCDPLFLGQANLTPE